MIPRNIKKEHIIKAIREIDLKGVPPGRESRHFILNFKGKRYSPKYVISLANKHANGKVLDPEKFGGGQETNNFLKKHVFDIREISSPRTMSKPTSLKKRATTTKQKKHDERCPKCKEVVRKLLEKICGKVEPNYKFNVGTLPEDFRNTQYYNKLKEIYETLQNHRGFKTFIKTKTLPHCDFFIPNPGFIVEFDESQHFTYPRKLTLENYPEELKLGFDPSKWVYFCEDIDAADNDPVYRDEQRAWYDTLRDFLPSVKGLNPTVRLFSKDFAWCSLNPNNPNNIKEFKRMADLERELEVKENSNPKLARIIISSKWSGELEKVKRLLENVYLSWPKGKKVKFIITCGGFIQFEWPKSLSQTDIGDNKYPNSKAVDVLVKEAEKCARSVLNNDLQKKLAKLTDYITLGIDSLKEKISTTQNYIPQLHIELVFLIDLKNNKFYWSGKSYPTSNQEDGLVRISDLKKHFFDLEDVGKVMLLGCHDLTVFNPMSQLNPNTMLWRKETNNKFREWSKKERPIYVLHHPHTTVKIRTWLNAWNALKKILPSLKICIGAGRYYEPDRERYKYDDLDYVLEATKSNNTNTIDFIF